MSTQILEDDRIEPIRQMESVSWNLSKITAESEEIVLDSKQSMDKALVLSADIKRIQKDIEAIRKISVEPSRKYIAKINDAARMIDELLESVNNTLKNKIAIYQRNLEAKAEADNSAAEKMLKSFGIAMDLVLNGAPKKFQNEDVIASTKTKWVFEIENDELVPLEFTCIDEAKIKKAIAMGIREIPGVKIFETKEMQIRRR